MQHGYLHRTSCCAAGAVDPAVADEAIRAFASEVAGRVGAHGARGAHARRERTLVDICSSTGLFGLEFMYEQQV